MNDKQILADAIKKLGLLTQTKLIWITHPILELLATKFAGYVGPFSKASNGNSLLEAGLKDAIRSFQEEQHANGNDSVAIGRFVKSIINSAVEVFSQRMVVETSSGDILWHPFVCSAADFIAKYQNLNISTTRAESNVPESIAFAFMMVKIIPLSMLDKDSLAELLNTFDEKAKPLWPFEHSASVLSGSA